MENYNPDDYYDENRIPINVPEDFIEEIFNKPPPSSYEHYILINPQIEGDLTDVEKNRYCQIAKFKAFLDIAIFGITKFYPDGINLTTDLDYDKLIILNKYLKIFCIKMFIKHIILPDDNDMQTDYVLLHRPAGDIRISKELCESNNPDNYENYRYRIYYADGEGYEIYFTTCYSGDF